MLPTLLNWMSPVAQRLQIRPSRGLEKLLSLFIEEAARMGTLEEILAEAGFERHGKTFRQRPMLAREKMRLTLPAA